MAITTKRIPKSLDIQLSRLDEDKMAFTVAAIQECKNVPREIMVKEEIFESFFQTPVRLKVTTLADLGHNHILPFAGVERIATTFKLSACREATIIRVALEIGRMNTSKIPAEFLKCWHVFGETHRAWRINPTRADRCLACESFEDLNSHDIKPDQLLLFEVDD